VERKVFLFEEQFEEEAVEAAVDVPVDVAEVVALDVGAVVGELDRLAALLGAALAAEFAREDLAARNVELTEPRHERGLEEVVKPLGTFDVGGSKHGQELNADRKNSEEQREQREAEKYSEWEYRWTKTR